MENSFLAIGTRPERKQFQLKSMTQILILGDKGPKLSKNV
jgi:hypothetical protein